MHAANLIMWSTCWKLIFLINYCFFTLLQTPNKQKKTSRDYQKCWTLVFWRVCFTKLFSCCTEKKKVHFVWNSPAVWNASLSCWNTVSSALVSCIQVWFWWLNVLSWCCIGYFYAHKLRVYFCLVHLVCCCACQEAHHFLPSFQPCLAYFEDLFSFSCILL